MNFILNPKFSDRNTPIRPEEAEGLIPRISTMAELNEYQALNIVQAGEVGFQQPHHQIHQPPRGALRPASPRQDV
jgi:hypothetical protein